MSTIVALVTDAFGGFGGISQYNRDFFLALSEYPAVERVTILPRVAAPGPHDTPGNVVQRTDGIGGIQAYALAAARLLQQERPSLVVCGHVNLLPFAAPIARRHHVPLVLLVHGIEIWKPPRLASRMLLPFVDHLVSVSQLTVDKMLLWCDSLRRCPVTLMHNAVDLERFRPTLEKPKHLVERYHLAPKRTLLTLARLTEQERYKGVDEVLELMPRLLETQPDINYLVVGDGNDLPRLKRKASTLNLIDSVAFAGRVDEAEKVAHYQACDAFVMPGRGEGFGFVFLEAMAAGLPVVASVLDGSREAVKLGALGELCDPRDQQGTIAAIHRALAKGRGFVPTGLDYFAMPNFRARAHSFLARALPT